jgi:hypothetical protein
MDWRLHSVLGFPMAWVWVTRVLGFRSFCHSVAVVVVLVVVVGFGEDGARG